MSLKIIIISVVLFFPAVVFSAESNELFSAAVSGNIARLQTLLSKGIDINSKTESGRTAVMGASFKGNYRIVKALLAYGADVNIVDNNGSTALMDAMFFADERIFRC